MHNETIRKRHKKAPEYNEYLLKLYPPEAADNFDEIRSIQPPTVTFQVTDACNLCCTYCYQGNKAQHSMTFPTAKMFVDKLLSGEFNNYLGERMGVILEFIGGEPLLEVDLIDKIIAYFRKRTIETDHPWRDNYMVSICSNGVLYQDERVQRFLVKHRQHLSFNITVDGTKELHDSCRVFADGTGSYDLAHNAVMDWKSHGLKMGSKITIAPGNIKYLDQCFRQMIKDGYDDINANYVFEDVWSIEDAKEAYRQSKSFADWMKRENVDPYDYAISFFLEGVGEPLTPESNDNACGGTGNMLAMDYKGDLFPCLRYMESSLGSSRKPYIIGNVTDGISYNKCTSDCVSCLKKITRRSQSNDECFYCPVAALCTWCSAYNYQTYGTADKRTTYICRMHMAQSLAVNYYWNTYYGRHRELKGVVDLWLPRIYATEIISNEEYDYLKELTLSLGGIVNEDLLSVKKYDKNKREQIKKGIYEE